MGMKKLCCLLLFVAGWLSAGCTADPGEVPEMKKPENLHAVSIEQALGELDAVLGAIDGQGTRNDGKRRVKSVEAVSGEEILPAVTRGADGVEVEDLFYLVNFENDEGYALLGADDRLEPVYAVLDSGSITIEELQYAATATPEQAAADGVLVAPMQMVIQAAASGLLAPGTGTGGGIGDPLNIFDEIGTLGPKLIATEYGPWETAELQGRLMKGIDWGQSEPYNLLCPKKSGEYCVAGCVPIAMAQILVCNALKTGKKFPSLASKPIENYIWVALEQAIQKPYLVKPPKAGETMTPETHAVAYFISVVGKAVNADYGVESTDAYDDDAAYVFSSLKNRGFGYKNIRLGSINLNKAREMVYLKKLPVYYGGWSASGNSGHAFVFEGWLRQERQVTNYYESHPVQYGTQTRSFVYVNMGWAKSKTGYYVFNLFTTSDGSSDTTTRAGATRSPKEWDYVKDFIAITYDLDL